MSSRTTNVGNNSEADEYRTTDSNLAAFLASNGLPPDRLIAPDPNTFPALASFVFLDSDQLRDCLFEWSRSGRIKVDLRQFLTFRTRFLREARQLSKGGAR